MKHVYDHHTIATVERQLAGLGCRNVAIELRGSGWLAKAIVGESLTVFAGTGSALADALDALVAQIVEATR